MQVCTAAGPLRKHHAKHIPRMNYALAGHGPKSSSQSALTRNKPLSRCMHKRLQPLSSIGGAPGPNSVASKSSQHTPHRSEALDLAQKLLDDVGLSAAPLDSLSQRGVFCNRTLDLRGISTIGYDMDYTLVHYDVEAWEGRAYAYGRETLRAADFPVDGIAFDPNLVIRGLVIDKDLGNIVKCDRFGYVKRAMHGTTMMTSNQTKKTYGGELVDLRKGRWVFLNTLFSVSEAVLFAQMVHRLDQGDFPLALAGLGYRNIYKKVSKALFGAHVESNLKAEIMQAPEKFIIPDPDIPLTLLDQKQAGKQLLLITNSDQQYTEKMMSFAFDSHLPGDMRWRDLFDLIVVSSSKPGFFVDKFRQMYEVVDSAEGLVRPVALPERGKMYCGGSARMVEEAMNCSRSDTIYIGDHIYTDVSVSKLNLNWRTCLIVRELESEIEALALGVAHRRQLKDLMSEKEFVSDAFNQLVLAWQRQASEIPSPASKKSLVADRENSDNDLSKLNIEMKRLDDEIRVMLETDGEHFNSRWGYLSRAGVNDKSHFTRQIEKYADIYTSRVSNLMRYTPYVYFRSRSQSLPHDAYRGKAQKMPLDIELDDLEADK